MSVPSVYSQFLGFSLVFSSGYIHSLNQSFTVTEQEKTRKLKFHEQKLLKKVDFLEWKREGVHRENMVMHRYHVTGRDDYKKTQANFFVIEFDGLHDSFSYSSLCRIVQKLLNILKQMDPRSGTLIGFEMTDGLLENLLATVMVQLKFAEHLKEAVKYIEQGHIRVGPGVPCHKEYARFHYIG